jgi:anti-anti-sigma regulatory factor
MSKHGQVTVDLSAVTGMGVAVMQVLLSAQVSLKAKGQELGCRGEIPEAVVRDATLAGLTLGAEDKCFWRRG